MFDLKALMGAFTTVGAAGASWVEQATAYGQLAVTLMALVVGSATFVYTILRIRILLRKERENA